MRHFVVAVCCLSAGGVLVAQQPTPPFKSGVTLVTIDVGVTDRDGAPVPGLAASDFEVRLNNRAQSIRAVTYVQAGPSATAPMAGAVGPTFDASPVAPVTGSSTATAAGGGRVFVIFVDDLSFSPIRGKALFTAAQRFVAELPAQDVVGLATSSGTRAVNPTRDRAAIHAALDTVVGEFIDPRGIDRSSPLGRSNASPDQPLGISESLDIERGDVSALKDAVARECFNGDMTAVNAQTPDQLIANPCASQVNRQARSTAAQTKQTTVRQVQAYQSVIKAMGTAAGLKHLVLLTDGLGLSQDTATAVPVARAAAEAGVQLSVVIEESDVNLSDTGRRETGDRAPQADPGLSKRRREDSFMFATGAQTVADMSGGTIYRVTGTADPFFRRIAVAASAVYRLAVELPADTTPGRDFALDVKVRRSGLSAHANRHAIAPSAAPTAAAPVAVAAAGPATLPTSPPKTLDEQLRAAVAIGRPRNGVPISLARAVRRARDPAQVDVGVRVEIPSTVKGPLTAMFGLVDEAGAIKSGKQTIDAASEGSSYQLSFDLPVTPGKYRLRFVVADAAGTIGAVESVVQAQLAAMGPFSASDVLISSSDATGQQQTEPPVEDLPAGARTVNGSLELYPVAGAAPSGDVVVKLSLVAEGQQQPEIERVVTPEPVEGVLRADAEFPVERLSAGTYTVQATVLIGANAIGTRSATIRKK